MDISVIIPLFNEEESLPELFAWIKRVMDSNDFTYEVIFVNDGSTDRSWNVIEELAEKNEQVVFRVATDATKPEVKAAVELLFKVSVESVQISNVKGKQKRFGRFMGKRNDVRKAYVTLAEGQEIKFEQEVM